MKARKLVSHVHISQPSIQVVIKLRLYSVLLKKSFNRQSLKLCSFYFLNPCQNTKSQFKLNLSYKKNQYQTHKTLRKKICIYLYKSIYQLAILSVTMETISLVLISPIQYLYQQNEFLYFETNTPQNSLRLVYLLIF